MSQHTVDILVDDSIVVDVDALHAALMSMLSALPLVCCELSVRLTNDAEIQQLNARWRGKVQATDVLSFPMQDDHEITGGLLGDIVISIDTAARQAAQCGHPLQVELAVLAAHGLAHVLGHDHVDVIDAQEMATLEQQMLHAASIPSTSGLIARASRDAESGAMLENREDVR